MRYLLAFLLPPIAALFYGGLFAFLINFILTCLGWIPGFIHAILVISAHDQEKAHRRMLNDQLVMQKKMQAQELKHQRVMQEQELKHRQMMDELGQERY